MITDDKIITTIDKHFVIHKTLGGHYFGRKDGPFVSPIDIDFWIIDRFGLDVHHASRITDKWIMDRLHSLKSKKQN